MRGTRASPRTPTGTEPIDLGKAVITPRRPLVAGSLVTLTYTYTAGHPIDDSGCVKVAFRFAGDFGVPQFSDPGAENFCLIRTTGDCLVEPRWDPKGHTRPWDRTLFLKVTRGYLAAGERIIVVFGDRSGGSPGWQVQTFCERSFEFKTLVDLIATCRFRELPASPAVRIVAGPAARAVCVATSQVEAGRPFAVRLKTEDAWGNPTRKPRRCTHPGFERLGVHRVEASDRRTGLEARSNPIRVVSRNRGLRPFWADLHGQSEETLGTNSIEDYFTFARDFGLVEIAGHQGNDFQISDEFWRRINRTAREFCEPGRFVTFPGYEWSGNTPLGGDRNVYFGGEGGRIVHSSTELLPGGRSRFPTAATADRLFAALRCQGDKRPFVIAHVGGRYADLGLHDPEIEAAVEVHSCWGTFEWLVEEALARGYRVGICAGSDDHKGRPGGAHPGARKFGALGGLTCILAAGLDRNHILRAIQARHLYATTGARMLLEVGLETRSGASAMMGDLARVGQNDEPRLRVEVAGTGPLESVEVRQGVRTLGVLRPCGEEDPGPRLKVLWGGAEVRGRGRQVRWDGELLVRGNTIRSFQPVNFWNPRQQPRRAGKGRLAWESVTTGGQAGVILTLGRPEAGTLEVRTPQGDLRCPVGSLGFEPTVRECGGLRKRIAAYRLSRRPGPGEYECTFPLRELGPGENAVYVRVDQEDGHSAWSSPVYVSRD